MNKKYNSIDDFKVSYEEGHESESTFSLLAKQKGFYVKKSNKSQDIFDHIDYFITKNNRTVSFDVKAKKRVNRRGSYTNDKVWIELFNVKGKKGWIDGKQDCIAFEFQDCFIIVNRKELRDYVYSVLDFSLPFVTSAKDAHYRIYQRKGRLDQITTINKEDLFKLNYRIWSK